jgi:hypothetical protein
MQVKCSFCKSPIDSASVKCEWCGSVNPVDKRSLLSDSQHGLATVIISNQDVEITNEKQIKAFLNEIANINTLHKTSSNKGLFGYLLDKMDGSNLEKRKVDLIDNFRVKMDERGLDMIFQKVQLEHQIFLKSKNTRDSIFNPNSSQELISESIMESWVNLLRSHLNVVDDVDAKKSINELINKY